MAKKRVTRRKVRPWLDIELTTMRKKAGKLTLRQFARQFKRSPGAVQQKASAEGISLRMKV